MKWSGTADDNSVNFLSKNGGLQLELTPGTAYRYRRKVAKAIFEVLTEAV